MKIYKTNHPNEVHQLNFSVSKHFFVNNDGALKYQKKPFEINLKKITSTNKRHLVNYVLRDHYSGTFYIEVTTSDDIISLGDFLHRAWSKKEAYLFCGIPEFLITTRAITDFFPQIRNLTEEFAIPLSHAKNGFHAGVRDIRTWESEIKWMHSNKPFGALKKSTTKLCAYLCADLDGKSKVKKWRDDLPNGTVTLPPKKDTFLSYYK